MRQAELFTTETRRARSEGAGMVVVEVVRLQIVSRQFSELSRVQQLVFRPADSVFSVSPW